MLKWILGCLGLIVVVVVCVVWFGYKKMKDFADAPPVPVTIMAPASRVFASMSDVDSMIEWRSEGLGMRSSRKGTLHVGDTLEAQMSGSGSRRARIKWIVSALTPDALIAFDAYSDSTEKLIFTRRDSLTGFGDSTRVLSTFTMPIMDSIRTVASDSGVPKGAMNTLSKLMVAGMRVASDQELKKLKRRIEGRAAAPDTTTKKKKP